MQNTDEKSLSYATRQQFLSETFHMNAMIGSLFLIKIVYTDAKIEWKNMNHRPVRYSLFHSESKNSSYMFTVHIKRRYRQNDIITINLQKKKTLSVKVIHFFTTLTDRSCCTWFVRICNGSDWFVYMIL